MVAAKERPNVKFTCDDEELKQVESFKYLGAIISATGDDSKEIIARLGITRSVIKSLAFL